MRPIYGLVVCSAVVVAAAPGRPPEQKSDWYERAVKKVEATFDPAEAKPGDTVTLKLTVHLNEGFHTYPTRQPDKAAEAMVNTIKFPDAGAVEFIGEVADPKEYKTKAEPDLGIKELRIVEGKVVYERKAVVSATAKPGLVTVKLPQFSLNVCDVVNCFPVKKLTPEATLKVVAK
jgi:hypothetical protein